MPDTYYLTKGGLKKLEAEFEHLKERRIKVSGRIEEAIKMGDLSENAEYSDAKDEQGFIEGRIAEVKVILRNYEIIKKDKKAKDEVVIGCTVEAICDGEKRTFTIVGIEEADPSKGFISHLSPIGKAFVGGKKGDTVDVETPGGIMKCKILKIS